MVTESGNPVETTSEAVEVAKDTNVTAATTAAAKAQEAPKPVRTKPAPKSAAKPRRKAKAARSKPQARANERKTQMKNDPTNIFAGFNAFPGANAFEKLFSEATVRGEEAAKRSRKAAEELANMYRGNVEAFVEAGRIATTGAQSIGQNVAAKSRDGLEQTANTVRTFAEAKSPTELMQLQSDFARSAFDRFVEESSSLTESFVKLAGEAFQPISNRASANVEKFNEIAA